MKRFLFGVVVGIAIGIVGVGVYLIFPLPSPPSDDLKFPVEAYPLPKGLWHQTSERRVGYAIYDNPKANPLIAPETLLPFKKARTVTTNAFEVYHWMNLELWVEVNGHLYPIAHAEKRFPLETGRSFTVVETVALTADRKILINVEMPERDLQETFGPYDLP